MDSLNEQDLMVFLLLCAQEHQGDSSLTPYSLYASSYFCTVNQKNWWITALDQKTSSEFLEHLATIRLSEERQSQFPPNRILFQTARLMFKAAQKDYQEYARRAASSYEQYAIQYFETAKKQRNQKTTTELPKSTTNRTFFVFPPVKPVETVDEDLLHECERISRQCEELKSLPEQEFPRTSSPSENRGDYPEFLRPLIASPTYLDDEEEFGEDLSQSDILPPMEPTVFITPPANKSRDVDVQTIEIFPSPPMMESPPEEIEVAEENDALTPLPEETATAAATATPSYPPFVDMIFSHMNGVNQWINRFYVSHEGIQNDVNTIRDRLEKLNRATSHMLYNNVKIFQTNPNDDPTDQF